MNDNESTKKEIFMRSLYAAVLIICILACACHQPVHPLRIRPLAQHHVVIDRSPDAKSIFLGTPGIVAAPDGRLVATVDLFGPGVSHVEWPKGILPGAGGAVVGKIFISKDNGNTWTLASTYPFFHARPFTAGGRIFVLGQCGDLMIVASGDGGQTWSKPARLTQGQTWHASSNNVWYCRGNVYLAMERHYERNLKNCWRIADAAPVLMRAEEKSDLTRPESWTFASSLVFEDAVTPAQLDYFGVPFYPCAADTAVWLTPDRPMNPIGWLEANVVQFTDPDHLWTDPSGRTFHLFLRSHTGRTGYAAMAKVVENVDGSMTTLLETAPSGKKILYTPLPGGQMKFYVLWDEPTRLFWMVGTQATDSMKRPESLPADRYNLPDNERRRLVLHFSKNMIDWCFAGLVAVGEHERASRHYCSMTAAGDDLLIVSRSGDEQAQSSHNGNLFTFHRVKNFRSLVY